MLPEMVNDQGNQICPQLLKCRPERETDQDGLFVSVGNVLRCTNEQSNQLKIKEQGEKHVV